jgi:hypothetical protein
MIFFIPHLIVTCLGREFRFIDKTIKLEAVAAFTPLQARPCSERQGPAEKVNEKRSNVNEGFAEELTGKGS